MKDACAHRAAGTTAPQQINLIDLSLRATRDWFNGRSIAALTVAFATLVGAHASFEAAMLSRAVAASIPAVPTEDGAANATPVEDAQMLDDRRLVSRGERLMQAVSTLSDLPHDNAQRLRAIISALPETLWLQEVEFSGERGVRVSGGAIDATALSIFAKRLGALPSFRRLPLRIFKVEPREAPQRQDPITTASDTTPPVGERPAHYSFVLSTFDTDPLR